jgi:hypothetical protein
MTTDLSTLQRRLRELIVAPNGVNAALDELGGAAVRALESVVRSDHKLDAVGRLEVYANAYFYRIRDCLENDFGALHATLGENRFHNLATAYLMACPPRHPSLRFAGDRLPDFIRRHPTAAPFRDDPRWLADLAHLEWTIVAAFDAADADILSRDELAAIDPVNWVDLRFSFQPALARLDLDFPAQRVRRSWDDDRPIDAAISELESIAPAVHPLLVWRTHETVSYRSLDPIEAASLDAAIAGETFGSLCEQLASEVGDGEAPNHAATLLARWQADGLIRGLTGPPPT